MLTRMRFAGAPRGRLPQSGARARGAYPGLAGALPYGRTVRGSEVQTAPSSESNSKGETCCPGTESAFR
eukprot:7884382-Alexandrium_andersonii.AAC.1